MCGLGAHRHDSKRVLPNQDVTVPFMASLLDGMVTTSMCEREGHTGMTRKAVARQPAAATAEESPTDGVQQWLEKARPSFGSVFEGTDKHMD